MKPMTSRDPAARLQRFHDAMARLPLIAILRGLPPDEAEAIGDTLYDAGFRLIEVPLNSPAPLDSIATLLRRLPPDAVIGAGTVTSQALLAGLARAGADLAVMPHADTNLVRVAKAARLVCVPGVATPTEAFAAIDAGADALKLFPAEMIAPKVLGALRAVLPPSTALMPVGGITPETMAPYRRAGATGFGLGSALYRPGMDARQVGARAQAFVEAWAQG